MWWWLKCEPNNGFVCDWKQLTALWYRNDDDDTVIGFSPSISKAGGWWREELWLWVRWCELSVRSNMRLPNDDEWLVVGHFQMYANVNRSRLMKWWEVVSRRNKWMDFAVESWGNCVECDFFSARIISSAITRNEGHGKCRGTWFVRLLHVYISGCLGLGIGWHFRGRCIMENSDC